MIEQDIEIISGEEGGGGFAIGAIAKAIPRREYGIAVRKRLDASQSQHSLLSHQLAKASIKTRFNSKQGKNKNIHLGCIYLQSQIIKSALRAQHFVE